jgi:hypothetical protein
MMQRTVWLTGLLPFLLLASAALSAPLALVLLWLYRRAVLRSMGRAAAASPPTEATSGPEMRPDVELTVRTAGLQAPAPASGAYLAGRRSLRRLAVAHGLGGLAYAAVFAAAWMIWVTPDGFILGRLLWFLAVYAWPAIIALALVAAMGRDGRLLVTGAYVAIVATIAGYLLARNPTLTPGALLVFWLTTNGPESVLVFAFLARRVRAVGPVVLAFVSTAVAGAMLAVQLAGMNETVLRRIAGAGFAAGLDATGVFVGLHVVGFASFAVLGWLVLRRLARRYQQKALSDQTLVVYAVVLVFGIAQAVPLTFSGWGLIATGPLAFAAYVAAGRLATRLLVRPTVSAQGPVLLLLRVFALGRRSQRLFDALSTRWLRSGSIALIAGPDLVTTTVEPHEFLDFVAGKLSRRFVSDAADLDRRLAELDTTADRDGRFRTNEFFCHADTWQGTMRRLSRRCDAVLMDLRGFAPGNAGCLYEIGQLLDAVPLDRVVFLIDATTDEPFLRASLVRLWGRVAVDSPNRHLTRPQVVLLTVGRESAREIDGLLRVLLAMHADGDGSALERTTHARPVTGARPAAS